VQGLKLARLLGQLGAVLTLSRERASVLPCVERGHASLLTSLVPWHSKGLAHSKNTLGTPVNALCTNIYAAPF
jgi:hypothetical protein